MTLDYVPYLVGGFVFVLGAAVGSFLSVCVHRLPKDESIVSPARSYCPACKAPLGVPDLVPLASFLALRARCRHCGARISWRYFALELVTGLLFLGAFLARRIPERVFGLLMQLMTAAAAVKLLVS